MVRASLNTRIGEVQAYWDNELVGVYYDFEKNSEVSGYWEDQYEMLCESRR